VIVTLVGRVMTARYGLTKRQSQLNFPEAHDI
jgi:hypothetical protein